MFGVHEQADLEHIPGDRSQKVKDRRSRGNQYVAALFH